ncbi:DUF1778 domain-containing protein [Pseudofrankia inefficax]|uniref:type II toxin-antitoxin system TacA family antitoxin n=1 Tax=Pseudofrankia inefficax (strain DSM 45817 / CECT 9037 / DDB 130130 / EuI1c) TaxID=298654 RepID=UPI0001BFBA0D|nr:DUF1778 domain-containing protein [Pseudofrankia inefficax]
MPSNGEGTTGVEVTVAAAVDRAKDAVADHRLLAVGDEAWAKFLAVLDRPAASKPRLERLFAEEPLFE